MKEHLNDLEIAKIEAFCADVEMFNAVKKVLFGVLYTDGVVTPDAKLNTKNGAFGIIAQAYSEGRGVTNEELGQGLRAKFEGVHTLLDGFENLTRIKSEKEVIESPYNEAE